MSKSKIQYMEKHRLTPLFEDLMNRVLQEQPDDPVVFLIKCLYKKAAIPLPKDLKPGNVLQKSSPERIMKRSKSPEKVSQSWGVASRPDLVDRAYDKPWLSNSNKSKLKEEHRQEGSLKPEKRQKSGWVSDTKVSAATFDELFETEQSTKPDLCTSKHKKEDTVTDITKAWAKGAGLEDSEDVNYRSRGYRGPLCQRKNDDDDDGDPLAGEIMLAKEEMEATQSQPRLAKQISAKIEAVKHKQDLVKILQECDQSSTDSGFSPENDDVQDDAIELLEDPDDLICEGVTNISKSGYKLSRILRQRKEEANVKLNINLFTGSSPPGSEVGFAPYDNYESDFERPPTGMSYQSNKYSEFSPDVSDEEFESVSQVVGPRQPVWSAPDSDLEPQHHNASRKLGQGRLIATAPVRFDDRALPAQSPETENAFQDGRKTWTPGQKSETKSNVKTTENVRDSMRSLMSQEPVGWNIPDTEVSVTQGWSEAQSSERKPTGSPKVY